MVGNHPDWFFQIRLNFISSDLSGFQYAHFSQFNDKNYRAVLACFEGMGFPNMGSWLTNFYNLYFIRVIYLSSICYSVMQIG